MKTAAPFLAAMLVATAVGNAWSADPRLRDIVYDAGAVVTVPVKRGVVTLVAGRLGVLGPWPVRVALGGGSGGGIDELTVEGVQ